MSTTVERLNALEAEVEALKAVNTQLTTLLTNLTQTMTQMTDTQGVITSNVEMSLRAVNTLLELNKGKLKPWQA